MISLNQEELLRYHRHLPVIGVAGQTKLKHSKILCLGGGGLGCPALQYLTASGIGTLGIIDGDEVELSNLQRQILFTEEDIGRNKAAVIAERLHKLNSHVSINTYQTFLDESNAEHIVAQYDVVLDASDNYPSRYLLNRVCRTLGKPLISASIHQFEGQLSVFNLNEGPCYQCLYPEPPPVNLSPNCSLSGVLGVLPGVVGCLQAMEAIKIILGNEEVLSGRLLCMNLLNMAFNHFEIPKQDCSQHPIIHFSTPSAQCQSSQLEEMTTEELAELMAHQQDGIQLLDVRELFEREMFHIGGSHIPLSIFTIELAKARLQQDKLIVVYCKSGGRSANACEQLINAGFKQVKNLKGGMNSHLRMLGQDPI